MAAVVTYICHHANSTQIHLIGHSMGGMIAMALLAHPKLNEKVFDHDYLIYFFLSIILIKFILGNCFVFM